IIFGSGLCLFHERTQNTLLFGRQDGEWRYRIHGSMGLCFVCQLPKMIFLSEIRKWLWVVYYLRAVMKVAYHPDFSHPLPAGHRFPMEKYELIPAQLLHEGVVQKADLFEPALADHASVTLAHAEAYCRQLWDLNLSPSMVRRIGFPLTASLVARELRIVQGTIDGCNFARRDGVAFNVAGGTHHAGSDWGEGFCLLNDQAVAAARLVHRGEAKQVLIVDLDVHQGNGTAEIFATEQRVFTFSMHGASNFPFRKERSDIDIGLPDGTDDHAYLSVLEQQLKLIFERVRPDFVFYQAGVDVLATDKLGKLAM